MAVDTPRPPAPRRRSGAQSRRGSARSLPVSFAPRRQKSAAAIRSSTVWASSGWITHPTLAVTRTPSWFRSRSAASTRVGQRAHRLGLASGASTANSSPPRRATTSPCSHRADQPCRGLAQHRVAGRVAVRRVHVLEAVEVHQHEPGRRPALRLDRQPVDQRAPVGQRGQGIEERQRLGALAQRHEQLLALDDQDSEDHVGQADDDDLADVAVGDRVAVVEQRQQRDRDAPEHVGKRLVAAVEVGRVDDDEEEVQPPRRVGAAGGRGDPGR